MVIHMFIYRKEILLDEVMIELELNRILRRIKISVDNQTISSFIFFRKNFSINEVNIKVRAFPVWIVDIDSPDKQLTNIFPVLKRKSERYLIGLSLIALAKLFITIAVNY
jgi:hypothetical protein